ncbi:MAG: methyltransferase domain-containing protein [Desulfobacterota bacterium]|nr:methyltransferase domain-containing protein [Thermodesulfobacteriota bacterium]
MFPDLTTQLRTVELGTWSLTLELPCDIDEIIDYYAQHHAADINLLPYYAELWPSAVALANFLLSWNYRLTGAQVIELGCGLGLPSLVAAGRGARVLATDFHPHNEYFLRRNIALNDLANIAYCLLDWNSPPPNLSADIIIGSDLIYESRNVEPFVQCTAALCKPNGVLVLADPGRPHLQNTVLLLRNRGFHDTLHIVDDIFIIEFLNAASSTR